MVNNVLLQERPQNELVAPIVFSRNLLYQLWGLQYSFSLSVFSYQGKTTTLDNHPWQITRVKELPRIPQTKLKKTIRACVPAFILCMK